MNANGNKNLDILIGYFTGTLEYDEYMRVKEHVTECASCQRLLAHLRKINANILRRELQPQHGYGECVHASVQISPET